MTGPLPAGGSLAPGEVEDLLRRAGAWREGHFLLTSGRHSPVFFLLSQAFQFPPVAERLGRALAAAFAGEEVAAVVGPAMGGVLLAHEVARALGCRSLFAEKAAAGMTLRRGFAVGRGERVLLVEDAVTTGGSVGRVLDLVRAAGAVAVGIGAVVDRRPAGVEFPVPFRALVRVEVPAYDPAACPLCGAGVPLVAPKA